MATSTISTSRLNITAQTSAYQFPVNAASIVDGNNVYTVQYDGIAVIRYAFANQAYSQFYLQLNDMMITNDAITSGSQNLSGVSGIITIPVLKNDKLKVTFYSTFGMSGIAVKVLYRG